ncbi:TIGR03757 family integrating conjugative element protein [Sedimenticola selenatireducens]|uniref:TIGR03757 family integrating conjugative element protein n=1 Tax=Sedimenticola selenatireducens TaxID=191960 RepID=UPI0009FC74FC|nr:TIGR03757 family integrating conjugative element protein [Sedimenticola selenatireducens]
MIRNSRSKSFVVPVRIVLVLFAGVAQAGRPVEVYPHLVEVFTTTERPISGDVGINSQALHEQAEFHVFELDGIWRSEANLSQGLPADPEQSKRVVLHRFQQLSEEDRARMQRAAMGLAKAMQYGVDRYPAIVFDGEAVVYGVTDVQIAIAHYRAWRQEGK